MTQTTAGSDSFMNSKVRMIKINHDAYIKDQYVFCKLGGSFLVSKLFNYSSDAKLGNLFDCVVLAEMYQIHKPPRYVIL
jgi:hypothetical protein